MQPPAHDAPTSAPRFAMVAGETSGDLLASMLLGGAHGRWPGLRSEGIGGPRMAQQGFQAWWPHDKLAVNGYAEVLRHLPEILSIRRQLLQRLLQRKPDLFIGVDAPDFNLDVEIKLREQGVKTIQYVCPAFWAWRPEKVFKLQRAADHVLCIFPFEPALLEKHGIESTFVGNPVANLIPLEPDRAAARAALGLSDAGTVVALLPGSRGSEIAHLGQRFLQAAALLRAAKPAQDIRFVLPAVPSQFATLQQMVAQSGLTPHLTLVQGRSHEALAACDVALVASGTATLETALFKRPMVISYHLSRLSFYLMRRKGLMPWVGQPNILLQDSVVPELLQDAATPEALARALADWLDAPERMAAVAQRFADLHLTLRRDTPTLTTHAIEKVLAR